MAFALTTTTPQTGVLAPAFSALKSAMRAVAIKRSYRATRRQLMALTEEGLADLGVSRGQIDRIALEAAIGSSHH